jgi:tripeptide aminopeptidase
MNFDNYSFTCIERFIRYVKIDTVSDPESKTYPSTEKQKDLGKVLVSELLEIGITDAHMDKFGYVFGTLECNSEKKVPAICFCSHMDTSPEMPGANVKPVIHKNYDGRILILPEDHSKILDPDIYPYLKNCLGYDIITTDGTTLLGADNKAGIAEIMDAIHFLLSNPYVKHGTIKILFTPDEEVGRGVDKLDMKKLGAEYGYTVDGGELGTYEFETFNADGLTIKIKGFNTHPGTAKDKMENAVKICSEIIEKLPVHISPEKTENRGGFVHPIKVNAYPDNAEIKFIIRDFELKGLKEKELIISEITKNVINKYPKSSYDIKIEEQYRNMKEVLDKHPFVVENAVEGIIRSGVEPKIGIVRGGTDGSRLSFMGMPCPNIFAGEMAIHSKLEFISAFDMKKAVETIVNICCVWEEKS